MNFTLKMNFLIIELGIWVGAFYVQRINMRTKCKCKGKRKCVGKCMGHDEYMHESAGKIYKC